MKQAWQTLIEVVAWLAPIVVLPLYLSVFISAGLSTGTPSVTFGGFVELGIAPVVSLLAVLIIPCFGKINIGTVVAMLIPALLSLAELTFAFLLWNAG